MHEQVEQLANEHVVLAREVQAWRAEATELLDGVKKLLEEQKVVTERLDNHAARLVKVEALVNAATTDLGNRVIALEQQSVAVNTAINTLQRQDATLERIEKQLLVLVPVDYNAPLT